jgi:aliphatic nitrilase
MPDDFPKFTAAAVQAAPEFVDREATVDKACHLIAQAAKNGVRLVVFPETWVPAYPFWDMQRPDAWLELYRNAVEVPSAATGKLSAAARKAKAYVAIGINERDARTKGSLYNSILYLGPDGAIMGVHRKLMPSVTERLVWGMGDGSGLHIFETPLGRLGGLICWEHEMTLVKYAMYARGEQVHASVWPAWTTQRDHIQFGTRQYAYEGKCFVVVSCGVLDAKAVPAAWRGPSPARGQIADGGSAIIAPDGGYIAGPVYGEETILYGEIDLRRVAQAKRLVDVAGHYSRPDVVRLLFDQSPHEPLVLPELAAEVAKEAMDGADGRRPLRRRTKQRRSRT